MRAGLLLLLVVVLSAAAATPARGRAGHAAAREEAAVRQAGREARASLAVRAAPGEPRRDPAMPTAAQLRAFRTQSDMPYARYVTGHFTGTTDEVIQWAARKWGFRTDLLRAVGDGRVVVADEHGRRQRRLVRALPGAAAVPLRGAGVPGVPPMPCSSPMTTAGIRRP